MRNSDLAHEWYNRHNSNQSNEGSNFFYEGSKIYSYGYHFCCANDFIDFVLINYSNYSATTAKHMNYVRYAIPNRVKTINVPKPEAEYNDHHHDNLKYLSSFAQKKVISALKRRKDTLYHSDMGEARQAIENFNFYANYFKLKKRFVNQFKIKKVQEFYLNALNNRAELSKEQQEKDKKEAKKQKLKREKLEKLQLQKFLAGEQTGLFRDKDHCNYLRLLKDNQGEVVQTSNGVTFALEHAKKLYTLLNRTNWEDMQKTDFEFSNRFRGLRVVNEILTIGCTSIKRTEADRFINSL